MIQKIVLENFMSHRRTVLEPAAGVTLLLGPNNCGKSAVLEALSAVINNDQGDWFVRHGATETRVEVHLSDNSGNSQRVLWQKGRKSGGWYDADGTKFERLAGQVPESVTKLLRLGTVEKINPHLAAQKAPIFLLNETAPTVAKFFSAGTDISLLQAMQGKLTQEKRDARTLRTRLQAEREQRVRLAAILEPIPNLEQTLAEANRAHLELESAVARQEKLRATVPSLIESLDEFEELLETARAVEPLRPAPPQTDTRDLARCARDLARCLQEAAELRALQEPMEALTAVPVTLDLTELRRAAQLIPKGIRFVEKHDRLATAHAKISPVPPLHEVAPLRLQASAIRSTTEEIDHLRRGAHVFKTLSVPPLETDTVALRHALSELSRVEGELGVLQESRARLDQEEIQLRQALESALERFPNCPVCHRPLLAEHLLEGHRA